MRRPWLIRAAWEVSWVDAVYDALRHVTELLAVSSRSFASLACGNPRMSPLAPLFLSRAQVREVDRRAIAEYGLLPEVLMENAGRGAVDHLERLGISGPVVICCGVGNNGGDGLVMARHLDLRGHTVRTLVWGDPRRMSPETARNLDVLERAGLGPELLGNEPGIDRLVRALDGAGWVVDALLGTGSQGEPRAPLAGVIGQINAAGIPVLAVDLPSGLDCDTGLAAGQAIRAQHTVTFVALKPGFAVPGAEAFTGTVHVTDIGVPRRLLTEVMRETTG